MHTKFDPEDPTPKALILPAFFLYPKHAISDAALKFDRTSGANLGAMFPRDAPALSEEPWDAETNH